MGYNNDASIIVKDVNFMKKLFYVVFFIVSLICSSNYALSNDTYYVTMNGRGSHTGKAYSDAWSWIEFLSSAKWSTTEDQNKIDSGDIVYFSGKFTITMPSSAIPGDGSDGNYIILDGKDGINPNATFTTENSDGSNSMFNFGNAQYFEMRDFTFNSNHLWENAIEMASADYIKIHDNSLNTDTWRCIDVRSGSTNIDIYDNNITWIGTSKTQSNEGIRVIGSNNVNIYRNSIIDWQHSAIDVLNDGSQNVSDVDIYENYISLDLPGYGRPLSVSGQYLGSGTTSNIYFHHNFVNKQRASLQLKSLKNAYVFNNVFNEALNCCEDNVADGIDDGCSINYFRCTGAELECIAENNPWYCCEGFEDGPNCGGKLWYGTGEIIRILTQWGDASNIYVFNNVFGSSAEAAIGINTTNGDLDNVHIINNIFYNNGNANSPNDDPHGSNDTWNDTVIYYRGSYDPTNVHIDNNMIYDLSGLSNDLRWDWIGYINIESFESGSPIGVVSKTANQSDNPDFTDQTNDDYSLTSVSPAIDTGQTLGQ